MKKTNSNTFKNATINVEKMTITEYTKDDMYVFDIKKILEDWDGVDGISLSIKKDSEVTD